MPTTRCTTIFGFASLILAASVLAACSSGSSSASTSAATATAHPSATLGFTPGTKAHPRVVVITATDQLMFTPMVIPVAKGETVTFQVKNTGTIEHEFMVGPMADAFADKEGTPEIAGITGGTTKSLTFTFDGPGPYAFACHATGHFEAGMKGTITLLGS
jgi:uncharacterized cupredoxin-like copper-binding protein